jgi:CRP/FNR family cyclic AMP-dependent transcriptional regulator
MKNLAAKLANHPFFNGLNAKHLNTLAKCAMQTQFTKDQLVFEQGDLANRFYLIQSGQVAIESPISASKWLAVQTIGPGEVLGWSWLFEPYRWHFRARALEPTMVIFFYGTRLQTHCEENKSLGYELVKRMAQVAIKRLESTQTQLLRLCEAKRN